MRKQRRRGRSRGRVNRSFNSGNFEPRKRRRVFNKKTICIVAGILAAILIFALLRNLFFFITESGVSDDEKYPVKGVDVSAYQKEIDWKGLESEGIRFAFIKATEGSSHKDKNFEYNWKEAHKTDMKVGAYHFMSYDTEGTEQAQNFSETVNKKLGMLPPAVDVEFYGQYVEEHPSREKMYEVLDELLAELEDEYNRKPLIYTNSYIYDNYISGRYDDYSIWISDHSIPDKLSDGRKWTFCQYTFKAKSKYVAGGEKYVDMNVFNGSKWDFRRYNGK